MDLQEYVDLLHRTEQSTDVNRWSMEGIRVWPLFRMQTITMFRNPEAYFSSAEKEKVNAPLSLKEKAQGWLLARQTKKKFHEGLKKKLNGKSCEVLLYSKLATHSDLVNGTWFDRFVDPFHEKLAKNHNVLKLQLAEGKSPVKKYAIDPVLVDHKPYKEHVYHCRRLKAEPALSGTAAFGEIVAATGIAYARRHVDSVFREITYYRDLFREILPHVKPKYIFLKCYYETDSAGLVLAARELGIKTIDIQHGKQGLFHPMYTHWSAIPEEGYNLLPDFFWNWGEESKQNIEKCMNRRDRHVPVVGGNLWMAKWKHENFYRASVVGEEFIQGLQQYERIVLLTLQPLDQQEMLPPHLVEAIRQSPAGWIWLLRKHPFQSVTREELAQLLGETKAAVELEFSSSLPLYFLLKKVHHHVTLWSSTCFEANDFDVPTIIAHEFGLKLYKQQVEENIFSYAVEPAKILQLITERTPNKKTRYIETDSPVAAKALAEIGLTLENAG